MYGVDILNGLNPQQIVAVKADPGPTLVLAGPGSGKTRVLAHRIAYLINTLGVKPHHILSVTFTNKAAREMEHRVEKLLDARPQGIWMGTFHGICARILRREAEHLPFDDKFVIFDDDDQMTLMKRIFKEFNLDEKDKDFRPLAVHAAISTAKNNRIFPEEYPTKTAREKGIAQIYKRYQQLLVENNAVDFDDLLLWTLRLMEENSELCKDYARRFEHILVDEFQDTNLVQYKLLEYLASYHQNIFVVGDEDQSIYRWRGADYRNVLQFEEDYPKAQKILLEQNYRSTQTVLDVASAVINQNRHRTPKRLRSTPEQGKGERVVVHSAEDDHEEGAFVVSSIRQLIDSGQFGAGDFAVMYRTNAQSRLIEEAFLHSGMPYRLVGAQRFYGRREIKDMIAYLRLVMNPADQVSLERVINVPSRKIGDKTLATLILVAQNANTSTGDVLMDLGQHGKDSPYWESFSRGAATQLAGFGALLSGWTENVDNMPLPELFDSILENTAYHDYIVSETEDGEERWDNVQELHRLTYEYEDRGLSSFLENLALVSDQDTVPEETEAPTLLTLHAAKGLEFSVVFITGLDDGLLPHSRSLDMKDPEEMDEERRLFYVGLTRAKRRIYLVRAEQRRLYGNYQNSIPSRFLKDIPENLIKLDSYLGGGSFGSRRTWASRWDEEETQNGTAKRSPTRSASAPIIEPRFKLGMRVRNSIWGEGEVLESRIEFGDETVVVNFAKAGRKELVASLANLEILPDQSK